MEIEIKSLALNNGLEIGMDQYKNIYSKPKDNESWEVIYEYRRIPTTRTSNKNMTLPAEQGLFMFAVDKNGKYWKRYKHYPWKEMVYEDRPKYYITSKIVRTTEEFYWTQELKNKTVIKRPCNLPLI